MKITKGWNKGFSWERFLSNIVLKDIAGVIVRMDSVMQYVTSFDATGLPSG